ARLLIAGAFAAVTGGEHARITQWASEAADLARPGDPFVLALASIWQAAPLMLPEPDVARALMDDARAAAAATQSRLCHGFVDCWSMTEELCAARSPAAPSPGDAERFGGRDSWGWSGAVQVGSIALAEQGRLTDALALVAQFSPLDPAPHNALGYQVMVTAIAGAPDEARRLAAEFIVEVDRFSDVVWHAELVLALAICHLHDDDRATAFAYLETAKRAPMFQPFWYELRRRYASQARAGLDENAIADTKQRCRLLTVASILDHELRAHRRAP
ncbi:MAG TPA: hypothetical protein VFV63_15195, partial [Ilumatobacteraceae bacterium]|nr:hypothetical protein [Ilumatobacteraceae bacterium]